MGALRRARQIASIKQRGGPLMVPPLAMPQVVCLEAYVFPARHVRTGADSYRPGYCGQALGHGVGQGAGQGGHTGP